MDHAAVSYRSQTIVLLMENDLAILFPCTTQMLGIRSCDVLLSYMWYTKQLIFCPYSFSCSVEMLNSSYPPSATLLLDMFSSIGSLPVVRMPAKPLPKFKTYVVSKGISSVVAGNSQIYVHVSYISWHASTFPSMLAKCYFSNNENKSAISKLSLIIH